MAWQLLKTLPGLKGGPKAWGDYSTEQLEDRYELASSRLDPCLHSKPSESTWVLRHMDDFLFVAPHPKL